MQVFLYASILSFSMSSIRIDAKHQEILDKLIAQFTLNGTKITKKKFIGYLIELAARENQKLSVEQELCPLEEDPAWRGLSNTFQSGMENLSSSVDQLLYQLKEEQ